MVRADGQISQGQKPAASDITPWIGLVIINWVTCEDLLLCIWSSDALLFVVLKQCVWSCLAPLCIWNVECADLCQHTCHDVSKFRTCQQAIRLAPAQAKTVVWGVHAWATQLQSALSCCSKSVSLVLSFRWVCLLADNTLQPSLSFAESFWLADKEHKGIIPSSNAT